MERLDEMRDELATSARKRAGEVGEAAADRAGAAWSVYSEKESAALRSSITWARELLVSTSKSLQAAQERVGDFVATGQSHAEISAERVRADVSSAAATYPEGVVATSTVLFATARGAANGTVLGQSPRLTLLFAAAVSLHQYACESNKAAPPLTARAPCLTVCAPPPSLQVDDASAQVRSGRLLDAGARRVCVLLRL